MKTKKKLAIYSFLGTGGIMLAMGLFDKFCITESKITFFCFSWVNEILSVPIFLLPLSLFVVSIIFFFVSEEIFQSWKKFAKIYLSISAAIILYFAFSGGRGGNFGLGGGMDAEGATMFLSAIFFILSIAIIIVKSRKLRGK